MSQTKDLSNQWDKRKKMVSSVHANSKAELSECFYPGRSFPNAPVLVAIHIDKATIVKNTHLYVDQAFFLYTKHTAFSTVGLHWK